MYHTHWLSQHRRDITHWQACQKLIPLKLGGLTTQATSKSREHKRPYFTVKASINTSASTNVFPFLELVHSLHRFYFHLTQVAMLALELLVKTQLLQNRRSIHGGREWP